MTPDRYDLAVIGSGPGGYVAAIRAAQLGFKTVCIEKRATYGGTCLNIGCIPSKALLQSSERLAELEHHFAEHGINVGEVKLDLAKMLARKDKVVEASVKGIDYLFKKNKVTGVFGTGRLTGPNQIIVAKNDGDSATIEATNIIIATGSQNAELPGIDIDEETIVSSTGALSLGKVPEHMVVIGGGYIGLEMASVWRRLGAAVTVVEFLDRVTPAMDGELSKQLQRALQKQGINFKLSTKVIAGERTNRGVKLTLTPAKGGEAEMLDADVVLVAIGRKPYTEGLELEAVGVALDDQGKIRVDQEYRTNVPSIYAIGDVITGPMLAHKASEEGTVLVERIAGQRSTVNYDAIPSVIYTAPEVATIGKSEEDLKAAGIDYNAGKFPFTANPRARANGDTEGFVKILADKTSDRVLGVHIIGQDAGTMISELAVAMEFGASSEDIARTCHPHPTLSEAVKEAALNVHGEAIHI